MPTANRFRTSPTPLMTNDRPSRTAEYMALFRAVETAERADRRLFDDPLAAAFLTGRLKALAAFARLPAIGRLATYFLDLGWPRTRSSAVVRTRLIDDLVRQAIRSGARQALLLGRGFRQPSLPPGRAPRTFRSSKSIIPPRSGPSASDCKPISGGCPATFISCRWISKRTTWKPHCCTRASTQPSQR
jgi:hypothetical protein